MGQEGHVPDGPGPVCQEAEAVVILPVGQVEGSQDAGGNRGVGQKDPVGGLDILPALRVAQLLERGRVGEDVVDLRAEDGRARPGGEGAGDNGWGWKEQE